MRNITFLFILASFFSCKKESMEEHINSFPVEVQEEVRTFLREGADRGVVIDIRKIHNIYLTGPISEVKSEDGGRCGGYYSHSEKSIYFDTTSHGFKKMREVAVFHELGHGLLKRDHFDMQLPNRDHDVSSIMNGLNLPDYRWTFGYKREYYLNEFFGKEQPMPSWVE